MIKTGFLLMLSALFLLFVGANVFASQQFPALFYELTFHTNKSTVTRFLETIRFQPEFAQQKDFFESLYGAGITDTITLSDQKKGQVTSELESVLAKNPASRDALVRLAVFYFQTGRPDTARSLYRQAKTIDPWLNITYLEN